MDSRCEDRMNILVQKLIEKNHEHDVSCMMDKWYDQNLGKFENSHEMDLAMMQFLEETCFQYCGE